MSVLSFISNYEQTNEKKNKEPELQLIYENKLYVLNPPRLYYTLSYINKLEDFNNFIKKKGRFEIATWFKKNDLLIEEFLEPLSEYWFTDI